MLILTRRVGECVVIGDSIEVSVLSVKGGQVRLGIKAPRDTPVHREEVIARGDAPVPLKAAGGGKSPT